MGMTVPISGGGYFRLYPYRLSAYLLNAVNRDNEPFVFYMHPWEVDPGQPRIRTSLKSRFRHYTNLERCETKLRALLRDFKFASMAEVVADYPLTESRRVDPFRRSLVTYTSPGVTRGDRTILQAIAEHFGHLFGPLRLFNSYLFLAGIANGLSVVLTFVLLPRLLAPTAERPGARTRGQRRDEHRQSRWAPARSSCRSSPSLRCW